MIVTCERCDTRFQLEDERVPASGARVRCSRCKHAFLVLPTGADEDETIHAIAADAAADEPTPPGVTDDLPAPKGPGVSGDESEWQFAEQQQPPRKPSRPKPSAAPASLWDGVLAEEKPPEARELDTLGSPESWSFVSEEAPPLRPSRTAAAAATAERPAAAATSAPMVLGQLRGPAPAVVEAAVEPSLPAPSRRVERVGWTLTGLLLVAIAHGIDWTGAAPTRLPLRVPLRDGLVVEDLSLRRLENLVAGPILVVAGAIANAGSGQAGGAAQLTARLVGASATAEVQAGVPRTPEALREAPPGVGVAALPDAPLQPGERVPFEAVFARPPLGDARLELRLESVTQEAPPATGDPSPPTPLPSSG